MSDIRRLRSGDNWRSWTGGNWRQKKCTARQQQRDRLSTSLANIFLLTNLDAIFLRFWPGDPPPGVHHTIWCHSPSWLPCRFTKAVEQRSTRSDMQNNLLNPLPSTHIYTSTHTHSTRASLRLPKLRHLHHIALHNVTWHSAHGATLRFNIKCISV